MSLRKSGEILRMGRGNYCFLCIHCGCNFFNMKEILAHIEYHFDIMDSAVPNQDANITDDSMKCSEFIGLPIEEICKTEMVFSTEDSIEEMPLQIELVEIPERSPSDIRIIEPFVSRRKKVKSKVSKHPSTKTEKKSFVTAISINDPRQCLLCESHFKNFAEYQSHMRSTHGMEKIFQCYICGTYHKSLNLLQRHLLTLFHSKTSCYQCELNPPITNELDARPHKCFICKEWFDNHMLFRKHFKNIHQKDVATFFRKKSNCNEFTCYVCKKVKDTHFHPLFIILEEYSLRRILFAEITSRITWSSIRKSSRSYVTHAENRIEPELYWEDI